MTVISTMSREILYEDGSGPRCKVSFDSTYRLGKDDDSYVRIEAIGGDSGTLVSLRDVPFLIEALQEAGRLDDVARFHAANEAKIVSA